MKLAWLPGNHTNHIWPCMITGKNESQKLIAGLVWCISYRMSVIAVTIRVVYNYFFIFCMKLVWLPGIIYDLVWNQGKLYDGQPGIISPNSTCAWGGGRKRYDPTKLDICSLEFQISNFVFQARLLDSDEITSEICVIDKLIPVSRFRPDFFS